jgi:membrane associated rhomboid family serine protease
MSEERGITPWVGRLMVVNATVLLLLQTVFTAPAFVDALQFAPGRAAQQPWTALTYMFVHGGLPHLTINMLLLFLFGPSVERRMGGGAFLLYFLYCGVGAAALALGLAPLIPLPPFVGASGAVLGVALAFALAQPDTELALFPLPLRVTARTLVVLLAGADLVVALWSDNGTAHVAHLGGIVSGYLFLRIQGLRARRAARQPGAVERRPVMTAIPARHGGTTTDVRPAMTRPEPRQDYPAAEVDRVLDKISATGIESLTPEERRFLDEVSRTKRKDLP